MVSDRVRCRPDVRTKGEIKRVAALAQQESESLSANVRKDVKDRIDDLASFLDEQTEAVTEYSETLVRRLIEKITVWDEMMVIEFKSGLQIEVET